MSSASANDTTTLVGCPSIVYLCADHYVARRDGSVRLPCATANNSSTIAASAQPLDLSDPKKNQLPADSSVDIVRECLFLDDDDAAAEEPRVVRVAQDLSPEERIYRYVSYTCPDELDSAPKWAICERENGNALKFLTGQIYGRDDDDGNNNDNGVDALMRRLSVGPEPHFDPSSPWVMSLRYPPELASDVDRANLERLRVFYRLHTTNRTLVNAITNCTRFAGQFDLLGVWDALEKKYQPARLQLELPKEQCPHDALLKDETKVSNGGTHVVLTLPVWMTAGDKEHLDKLVAFFTERKERCDYHSLVDMIKKFGPHRFDIMWDELRSTLEKA